MEQTDASEAEQPSLLKRAMIVIAALSLIGLVVVAVLVAANMKSLGRQIVTLPDGSQFEFLGTALGNTNFTTERPWHRTVRRLLPDRLTKWLPPGITANCNSGSTNGLTVYFRHISATATVGGLAPWNSVEAEDAAGFRYGRSGGYCSLGGAPGSVVYGVTVTAFPRREPEFLLRISSGSTLLGSFRLSNPVPGSFPEWQPLPVPQVLTNGPVILTLQGLKRQGTSAQPRVVAEWRLQAPSQSSWSNARVRSVTYLDATGNEGQILSPREPAWKVRALVAREKPEDFAINEKLTLTNLAVPTDGNFLQLNRTADCAGLAVTVMTIAGPGKLTISNGVAQSMVPGPASGHGISTTGTNRTETWGNTSPFFLVEVKNTLATDDIQFRMRDDRDRDVKVSTSGWSGTSTGTRTYQPYFTPPPDAKSLTLLIIVNRPLTFEFMVNPADVTQAVK